MKVTVLCSDNTVVVDGVGLWVDCADVHGLISVIQWDGEEGWIEFYNDNKGRHIANVKITDFSPYTFLVEKWNETKAESDAKAKAVAEANQAAKEDGPAALSHIRAAAAPRAVSGSASSDA